MTLNISVVEHSRDPQPAPDVEDIERYLAKLGYYGGKIDGIFGDMCRNGTYKFQGHVGIHQDGIVGPDTLQHLKAAYAKLTSGEYYSPADKAADMMYKWVMTGNDGSRPIYVWAAKPALSDPSPDKSDCSGGTQWAVGRVLGHAWVHGSRNQYDHCRHIPLEQGIKTKGALLFSSNNGKSDGVHHVAFSMGNGKTAECRSAASDCGSWDARDGRFNLAALVPELKYG